MQSGNVFNRQYQDLGSGQDRVLTHPISTQVGMRTSDLTPLRDWDAVDFHFTESEVELMAKMEHDRWVQERRCEGRNYAEDRVDDRKLHPSLVAWEDLSESEKEKNRAFIRDLPPILTRTGFQVQSAP
jgi:hypothetical protein